MLKKFQLFEFNRHDKYKIFEIDDYFTIALEIEIKTNDKNIKDPTITYKDKLVNKIKLKLKKDIILNDKDYIFIDKIINKINFYNIDFNILNLNNYKDEKEKLIIEYINYYIINFINNFDKEKFKEFIYQNEEEKLILNLKKYLPNFYIKYNKILNFKLDMTIGKGIEIVPKLYIIGLNRTIQFINDFYNDFNNQNYWYMNNLTGLHINIGVNKKYDIKYNKIKGLILLKDYNNDSFVYRNNIERKNLKFTQSLLLKIKQDFNLNNLNLKNINNIENIINIEIDKILKKYGAKSFGFNLLNIEKFGYVEFRYPGDNIKKDTLIEKVLYFCYIIYCMTNEKYKRNKYLKELYKFIN